MPTPLSTHPVEIWMDDHRDDVNAQMDFPTNLVMSIAHGSQPKLRLNLSMLHIKRAEDDPAGTVIIGDDSATTDQSLIALRLTAEASRGLIEGLLAIQIAALSTPDANTYFDALRIGVANKVTAARSEFGTH